MSAPEAATSAAADPAIPAAAAPAAQGADAYRASRVKQIEERGTEAYPHKFQVTHRLPDFIKEFEATVPNKDDVNPAVVSVAGRVTAVRASGKALKFITLQGDGATLQVLSRTNDLKDGEAGAKVFDYINRGDIVGIVGNPLRSKTGELSISTHEIKQLSTCFHMVPTAHSGFKDMQFRFRQRYLDLIMNDKARRTFVTRSKIITYLRKYFDDKDFLEVETPMMNTLAGGATARPFKTHHNELNIDMFMRIAPELYLKMLIVGGLERVYEIGRNFRNEGIDLTHNPEFTMIEFYWAYVDYKDLMKVTQELLVGLVQTVCGKLQINYCGKEIDFSKEFGVIEFIPSLEEKLGVKFPADLNTEEARVELQRLAGVHKIEVNPPYTTSRILDAMMGQLIEPDCVNPTFIIDHPKIMSPLAKWHRKDPLNLTERFELFVAGRELCNAYTELNAPIVQRATFEQQANAKAAGDDEAQPIDEGYIRALEYGLPPTGGFGMGIDRLTMLLTDQANIREVILFPAMRPNEGLDAPSAEVAAAESAASEGDVKHGKPNHPVGDGKKAAAKPAGKGGKGAAPAKVVEDATLFDFRVGKVLTVERHPDADSLYVETIDVGEEKPRQIVSGLVKYIKQEEFVGKNVIIFANLQPKPLRGKDSFGMVLCAEIEANGEKQSVELVAPPEGAKPGDKISFGTLDATVVPPAELPRKIVERLMPKLKTDENGVLTWESHQWLVNGAPCGSGVKNGIVK